MQLLGCLALARTHSGAQLLLTSGVLVPCREAESFKEQGNAYYAKKDYNEAYNYYTKAIGEGLLVASQSHHAPAGSWFAMPQLSLRQHRLDVKCPQAAAAGLCLSSSPGVLHPGAAGPAVVPG